MRKKIPIETRIAMALAQLGNENSLQMCGKVYGTIENMSSITMRELCLAIRKHLKPFVIIKLTKRQDQKNHC